jgi:hypothetical protein
MDPFVQGTPSTTVLGVGSVITAGLATGRVVSAEVDPTTKLIPLVDGNGKPTGRWVIPQEIKGKFRAEMQSDVTPPAMGAGANYTIGGIPMYLDKDPKRVYTRGEIATWEFDLTAFPS